MQSLLIIYMMGQSILGIVPWMCHILMPSFNLLQFILKCHAQVLLYVLPPALLHFQGLIKQVIIPEKMSTQGLVNATTSCFLMYSCNAYRFLIFIF